MTKDDAALLKVGASLCRSLTNGISTRNWFGYAVKAPTNGKRYEGDSLLFQLEADIRRVGRDRGQHGKATAHWYIDVKIGAHTEAKHISTIKLDSKAKGQKTAA